MHKRLQIQRLCGLSNRKCASLPNLSKMNQGVSELLMIYQILAALFQGGGNSTMVLRTKWPKYANFLFFRYVAAF